MTLATITATTPAATIITRIPFSGLYASLFSGELDHTEEREAEYAEARQDEDAIPPELQLTSGDFSSILFDVTDYNAAHSAIAALYAEAFVDLLDERVSFKTGLTFESMSSPREYNFETDRLFCEMPHATAEVLLRLSAAQGHAALKARVSETFTSRSGFISGYSNDVAEWLEKPIAEWDHNELCSLIEACLTLTADPGDQSLDWQVFDRLGDEAFYNIHSDAVDWDKYAAKVQDRRDELAEQHKADVDPDYVPPPVRCSHTIDMFLDKEG